MNNIATRDQLKEMHLSAMAKEFDIQLNQCHSVKPETPVKLLKRPLS